MKIKFTSLTLVLAGLLLSMAVSAQSNYRSRVSGNWHDFNSWEIFTAGVWVAATAGQVPSSTDLAITIQNTHTITVAAGFPITTDETTVAAGGALVVNAVLTINDGAGTDLTVAGTLTHVSTMTGVATASVAIDGIYNWNGGTLAVPTTIGAAGSLFIAGGDKDLNTILTNNGTATWSASTVSYNSGTLTNNGTFTATGNNTMAFETLVNAFNNTATGIFNKNSAGTTTFTIPVTNAGAFNLNAGTISSSSANGSFTNSGSINFTAGTVLGLSGTVAANAFNAGTTVTGTGTLTVNTNTTVAGAVTLPSTVTFNFAAPVQTLSGAGSLTVNGPMNWSSGTIAVTTTTAATSTLNLNAGVKTLAATLTNDGSINWNADNVGFTGGTLTNNGTLNAIGNNTFVNTSGTNAFTNAVGATFTKSTGTLATTIAIPASNAGTINITTGILANSAAVFTNTGAINFSGTILQNINSGTFNFNAGSTTTGVSTYENRTSSTTNINAALTFANLVMTTGTVQGPGTLAITNTWDWQATVLDVITTINAGATATLAGGGGHPLNANLINNGTINWVLQNINFADAIFTNNGTINEVVTPLTNLFMTGTGTNAFINAGIFNKTTTNVVTINLEVPKVNSGILQGSGTYVFTGGITNTGTISPGTPTTPSILTSTNNIITATGNVEIEVFTSLVPGTGHDQLAMSTGGATALTGTLTVVDNAPAPLGVYTILTTPGTFTGTFTTVVKPANFGNPVYNATTVTIEKLSATLPVIWGSFTALSRNNQVQLAWKTLQEMNTSHFEVEHSTNGVQFASIGNVAAKGNSSNPSDYSFTHTSPATGGKNFYRLKQVDLDNKFEYSVIRQVHFNNGAAAAVVALPNPVRDMLQVSIQVRDITIYVTDVNGKVQKQWRLQPGTHMMNVRDLPAGNYQLSIYQKQQRIDVQKIMKL